MGNDVYGSIDRANNIGSQLIVKRFELLHVVFELILLYNQLGPPGTYKIGSSDLGSFTCIVVLQIDYRRPLVGRPEASKPRGVDGGVGWVDPMV